MSKKTYSPSFLFLIILFALGILFASQYTPGTERIATFSVSDCNAGKLTEVVDLMDNNYDSLEKIFVDTKTNIFSVRYESSILSIDSVKSFFATHNLTIESSNSVNLMKEKKKVKEKKLFKISFSSM